MKTTAIVVEMLAIEEFEMKSSWLELEKLLNHPYACRMGDLAEHQCTKLKVTGLLALD